MGSICNSSPTTTQNYTPAGAGTFNDIINRATSVASQPYTPYTGELVAGVNPQQTQGISGINQYANAAQPYINTAAAYGATGANPLSQTAIGAYLNPFQQDVTNATIANINETNAQQAQALKGNAISSGAFGGDRAGIAQAELARQQGLANNQTLAGLNQQNYNQAVANAQADRAAAAQGAYTFGNLGTTAQGAGLQGAGAQIQAGTLQQQTQQAADTAAYNQFLTQQAFPYQQTQWLAGIGLPAAGALGGTQTTTAPSPSPFSQIAGLGLSAASLFLKRGGRVDNHYDMGGSTPYSSSGLGWIPSVQIQMPQQHQFGSPGASSPPGSQLLSNALGSFGKSQGWSDIKNYLGSGSPMSIDNYYTPSGTGDIISGGTGLPGFGGLYARGGRSFADGGVLPFADRAQPVIDAVASGLSDPQGSDYTAFLPPANAPIVPTHVPTTKVSAPMTASSSLPPEITSGLSRPAAIPDDVMAYDQGSSAIGTQPVAPQNGGFLSRLGFGGLSDEQRAGLLSAGLGIMAGTSPFGLANIGAGGLKGVQAMQEYREEQLNKQKLAQSAQIEGERLAQQLLMHREITPYQEQELKLAQQRQSLAEMQPVVIGEDILGRKTYAVKDPQTGQYKPIAPGGQTQQPGQTAPGGTSTTGPEIGQLPAQAENAADMISDYRLPPMSGFALRTPYGQAVMGRVLEKNPDYNSTFYNEANKTRSAFSTGPQGNAVRSFGVGISHLDVLSQAVDALNNGDTKKLNAMRQYFQKELGTSTAPTTVDAIKPIVAAEITKAIAGGNMALADREEIQAGLSRDLATQSIKDVIEKYQELMGGQLLGFKRQFESGTHGAKDFETKLSPAAVQMLHRAQVQEKNQGTGVAGASQDKQALDWANANPNDPRSAAIKKKLGVQ